MSSANQAGVEASNDRSARDLASAIRKHWEEGAPVNAQEILAQNPELATYKSFVLDLVYEEFCQRVDAGENLDPDEFCARFPRFQTSLREQFKAHRYFQENPDWLPDLEPLSWPQPGSTFLGFSLLRELGRGALARVFLAKEPALGDRQVAVKISVAYHGASEAETLGRLNHPNVVPVHSVQTDPHSGLTVVCMPYVGGATLLDVLDYAFAHSGPPSDARIILDALKARQPEEPSAGQQVPAAILQKGTYIDGVLHLAVQLAESLAFIHARGVCHRDLKPTNVLMGFDGTPLLLDFNLAFDQQVANHRLGGTVPYMSPEQLLATDMDQQADSTLLDARSDLFSLGVMLYELLAGSHPFGPILLKLTSRELRKQLLERQQGGPLPLRAGNPRVDRPLARAIERCLAYNPNQRPQSATELAAAFRKSLTRWRRTHRWLARHRQPVLGAAGLALALSFVAAYFLLSRAPFSQRQLQRGLEAYRQGQHQEAIQHFDSALRADPSARAFFLLGRAHQQQGRLDLALTNYENADRLGPDGQTKACLGYCKSRLRQHREAIEHYLAAIQLDFTSAAVFNNLGFSYLQLSQLDQAEQNLNQALKQDDRLREAYYNRALLAAQRLTSQPDVIPHQGISDIRKAIELGPAAADHFYEAAYLCAYAARSDNRWAAPALGYLQEAHAHGKSLKGLASNPAFAALTSSPRFRELLQKPASQQRFQIAPRLIDPIASD